MFLVDIAGKQLKMKRDHEHDLAEHSRDEIHHKFDAYEPTSKGECETMYQVINALLESVSGLPGKISTYSIECMANPHILDASKSGSNSKVIFDNHGTRFISYTRKTLRFVRVHNDIIDPINSNRAIRIQNLNFSFYPYLGSVAQVFRHEIPVYNLVAGLMQEIVSRLAHLDSDHIMRIFSDYCIVPEDNLYTNTLESVRRRLFLDAISNVGTQNVAIWLEEILNWNSNTLSQIEVLFVEEDQRLLPVRRLRFPFCFCHCLCELIAKACSKLEVYRESDNEISIDESRRKLMISKSVRGKVSIAEALAHTIAVSVRNETNHQVITTANLTQACYQPLAQAAREIVATLSKVNLDGVHSRASYNEWYSTDKSTGFFANGQFVVNNITIVPRHGYLSLGWHWRNGFETNLEPVSVPYATDPKTIDELWKGRGVSLPMENEFILKLFVRVYEQTSLIHFARCFRSIRACYAWISDFEEKPITETRSIGLKFTAQILTSSHMSLSVFNQGIKTKTHYGVCINKNSGFYVPLNPNFGWNFEEIFKYSIEPVFAIAITKNTQSLDLVYKHPPIDFTRIPYDGNVKDPVLFSIFATALQKYMSENQQ
uniref:Uncharacterized protein n=1 Tax=Tetranychus urticae TaxID=32264 RepID=T1KQL2_TETUR